MSWRAGLLSTALGALVLLGTAGTAQAHDRNCLGRIQREELKLDRDIRRHGLFGRQAQHRRENLLRLRNSCSVGRFGFRDRRRDDRRWGHRRWNWRWQGQRFHRWQYDRRW